MNEYLSIFQERNFVRLFAARTISMLGNSIAPVALAFAVLGNSGNSASDLGLVLAARSLAQVLFLLYGGVIADRFGRVRIMVSADFGAFIAQGAVAALILFHSHNLIALMALSSIEGAASALFMPASIGVVPSLVPPAKLQSANAMLRLSLNFSKIAGTALSGILITFIGSGWALALDAGTFLISALLALGLPTRTSKSEESTNMIDDLKRGWRKFSSREWVWVIVCQFSIVNACSASGFGVLGPVITEQKFGGALVWSIIAAAQAAGLVGGSLIALRLRPRFPMRAATYATFGLAAPLLLLALHAPIWIVVLSAAVCGICNDIFSVLWETGLQTHIPEKFLSRVSAYDMLGSFALIPIAQALIGPISLNFGVSRTLFGAGVFMILASAAALLSSEVRQLNNKSN